MQRYLKPLIALLGGAALALGAAVLLAGVGSGTLSWLRDNDRSVAVLEGQLRPAIPENLGGTGPLVIPAAAFGPDGNAAANDWFFSFAGGYVEGAPAVGAVCQQAPVHMPADITLARLSATVFDNTAQGDVNVDLYRVEDATGVPRNLARVSTTAAFAQDQMTLLVDDTVEEGRVDTGRYSYFVGICVDDNVRLYAVQVDYVENVSDVFLPGVIVSP